MDSLPGSISRHDGIAARIGTKEGVEEGDKYDVYQYDDESKNLKKIGNVKVMNDKVWDNIYFNNRNMTSTSSGELKKRDKEGLRTTETVFKGSCNIQPGMFLRKSN